jgi:hypothetical protein
MKAFMLGNVTALAVGRMAAYCYAGWMLLGWLDVVTLAGWLTAVTLAGCCYSAVLIWLPGQYPSPPLSDYIISEWPFSFGILFSPLFVLISY